MATLAEVAAALYADGMTIREIATATGYGKSRVHQALRAAGVDCRRVGAYRHKRWAVAPVEGGKAQW